MSILILCIRIEQRAIKTGLPDWADLSFHACDRTAFYTLCIRDLDPWERLFV